MKRDPVRASDVTDLTAEMHRRENLSSCSATAESRATRTGSMKTKELKIKLFSTDCCEYGKKYN